MESPPTARPQSRSRPARVLRVLAKVALWMLGALLGLLLLAWLAFVIFFPDEKLRTLALEQLEQRTGLRATAGRLELDVFSGLVLSDVKFEPPAGYSASPLTIERVVADYSLAELLSDRLIVRRLRIERPVLVVESRAGRSNFAALADVWRQHRARPEEPAGGQEPEPGLQVDLQSVEVVGAGVRLAWAGDQRLELDGLDLQLTGGLGGQEGTRLQLLAEAPAPSQPNLWIGQAGPRAAAGLRLSAELQPGGRLALHGQVRLDGLSLAAGHGQPVDLTADFELDLDLTRDGLTRGRLRIGLDGSALLEASGELPGLGPGLLYRARVARMDLGHPALVGLAGAALGFRGRAWLEGADLQGELANPLASQTSGTIVLDGFGLSAPGVAVSDSTGRLRIKSRPAPEGGARISIEGQLAVSSAELGPVRLGSGQLELAAEAHLQAAGPGVRLEQARLRTSGRFQAVGAFRSALELSGVRWSLDLAGSGLRLEPGQARLDELTARVGLQAAGAEGAGLQARRPALELDLSAGGLGLQGPFSRPARIGARLKVERLEPQPGAGGRLPDGSRLDSIELRLATRLRGLSLERLPLTVGLSAQGAKLGRGADAPAWSAPGEVRIDLDGQLDLGSRVLELARADLRVADLLDLAAHGRLELARPALDLSFESSEHRLERLVAALPVDVSAKVPPLAGLVQLSGRVWGQLAAPRDHQRLPFSVELSVAHREIEFGLPAAGLTISGLSGPIELKAGPAHGNRIESGVRLDVERVRVGALGIEARRLGLVVGSSLVGEQLRSDGRISVAWLDSGGRWPLPIEAVSLQFGSSLTGLKDLRLDDLSLSLGSAGLTLSGTGQVVWTPGSAHWSDLRLSATTRTRFSSNTAVQLPGGLSVRGEAEVVLGLFSTAAGLMQTEGRFQFGGLDLAGPGLALEGIFGTIPVGQLVQVQPDFELLARGGTPTSPEADSAGGGKRSSAYEQAVRPLKGQARTFSIRQARFKDLVLSDLSGNLELAAGVLSLGSLRFGLWGGDVVSDTAVVFAPPAKRRLELDAEMSGIDLSRLGALSLAGASDISGNLRLRVDFNERDLSSAFNLTRIGRSTLQALLVAVDPQEANPGLLGFRRFLTGYQVSPREVNLDVRHGLLSMRARVEMGPLARAAAGFVQGFRDDTFAITHIPVGNLLSKYLEF